MFIVHRPLSRQEPWLDMLTLLCFSHTQAKVSSDSSWNLILCSFDYFKSLPIPFWTWGRIVRNEFNYLPPKSPLPLAPPPPAHTASVLHTSQTHLPHSQSYGHWAALHTSHVMPCAFVFLSPIYVLFRFKIMFIFKYDILSKRCIDLRCKLWWIFTK